MRQTLKYYNYIKKQIQHKKEHLSFSYFKNIMKQHGLALLIIIVGWEIVEDIIFPFIFWQFWSFVKPALKDKELSVSKGVIFWASLLFFFGIAFGYFLISPLCVQFFGNYKILDSVDNNFRINSYLSMITTTTFLSGLFFELPVVIFISTKLGLVSPELLKKYRRHAIVVVLILAALITPPDVISQVMVAIPIMLLYEAGIYVSKLVVNRKQESTR